jgi:hypothetical protein
LGTDNKLNGKKCKSEARSKNCGSNRKKAQKLLLNEGRVGSNKIIFIFLTLSNLMFQKSSPSIKKTF